MQPYLRTQEASETIGSLKKWGKRKVITIQTTQTLYLRIAYKTCSFLLLRTKLLTAMNLQRNLKKTWVHENIVRERKTLLPFDLVLKLKWQDQNALPPAIRFALPFRTLPVSARESALTWYLLHCKTIACITVQTNLLINLGLIFHGQKGNTSRCRAGWTTRCISYSNTGDSWQHRVQTFLTGHYNQQDIPKEELEGHNSDPLQ